MKNVLLRFSKIRYFGIFVLLCSTLGISTESHAQDDWSAAREWNEEILYAITQDFGRPTIHARNLYHLSGAMYDSWAAYEPSHDRWLLGRTRGNYNSTFQGIAIPSDPEELKAAREETMAFAVYRLMSHRFIAAPGFFTVQTRINDLMAEKGFNPFYTSTNYVLGGPAALGNYIAQEIINYGYTDGANELNSYANQFYQGSNGVIFPEMPGAPNVVDPNLWQPISVTGQLDQAGNPIFTTPPHLSPEWGHLVPFGMTDDHKVDYDKDGDIYPVYLDPGPPPLLDPEENNGMDDLYKWGFTMVAVWGAQLDGEDDTMWDISPGGIGNVGGPDAYPQAHTVEEFEQFYDFYGGGEQVGPGHAVNPKTGLPYEPNLVKRSDYVRVLGEFWADGPASYTPPGHWYEIVNHAVFGHPDFERRWMGEGDILDDLEYDVKLYFTLGGAMYDAAVTAWSIKGYYDYVRPVSAIRYMCDMGQCSDTTLDNYHPAGIPLIPGFVEVVEEGDPLAGDLNEHVGKIKLYTWRGPIYVDYVNETLHQHPLNQAGVDWILGENWWPYMKANFVSPPFAGYVSGHSTFSSTAAQVMEMVTGDAFFPGGMGVFVAEQDEFLETELGPSETVELQWATYRDASDQTSLSRIWIGIHPPQDDINGRFIGMELGDIDVNYANSLFDADRPFVENVISDQPVYNIDDIGNTMTLDLVYNREMNTAVTPTIQYLQNSITANSATYVNGEWFDDFTYRFTYELLNGQEKLDNIQLRITNAQDTDGKVQNVYLASRPFLIDTERPDVVGIQLNESMLNDQIADESTLIITIEVDEEVDMTTHPDISFVSSEDLSTTLIFNSDNSEWIDEFHYEAHFTVVDNEEEIDGIGIEVSGVKDAAGNDQNAFEVAEQFDIDTRNPELANLSVNTEVLNIQSIGNSALVVSLEFDEEMNTMLTPTFIFPGENPLGTSLNLNNPASSWLDNNTYQIAFNLTSVPTEMFDIQVQLNNFRDLAGNDPAAPVLSDLFEIDTQRPEIVSLSASTVVISDSDVGTNGFQAIIEYNEAMDTDQTPVVALAADGLGGSVNYNPFNSQWLDEYTFEAVFNVVDENIEVDGLVLEVSFGRDASENFQNSFEEANWINLDTRNPEVLLLSANTYVVTTSHIGEEGFNLFAVFDEAMRTDDIPDFALIGPVEVSSMLSVNNSASQWVNNTTYQIVYNVANQELVANDIDVILSAALDMAGNEVETITFADYFDINTSTVGIAEENSIGMSFYPNPIRSGQSLQIEIGQPINNAVLRVISIAGATQLHVDFKRMEQGMINLPLNELASGLYLLRLDSDEGSQVHRMVIID